MKIDHSKHGTQNTHKRGSSSVMGNDKKCKDEVNCIGWFCHCVFDELHPRMSWLLGITGYCCSVEHYPSSSCSTSRGPDAPRIPCEQQSAVLGTAWLECQSISSEQQTASLSSPIVKSSALHDLLLDAKGMGAIPSHFHARYHVVNQRPSTILEHPLHGALQ